MFAHRLAIATGAGADVDGMLAGLTAGQFLDWFAYWQCEPFGEERGDLRIAMLIAKIHNLFRGKSPQKRTRDFMPRFGPPAQKSPEQLAQMFQAAYQAMKRAKK